VALQKRELAKIAKGPVANDEDWWHLVHDTATGRVSVIHSWAHVDVRKSGKADSGCTDIELEVFLNQKVQNEAQRELRRLIASLCQDAGNAHRT
jgi:hypothetical protein